MFKFRQFDKEDFKLSADDLAAFEKQAKASYHASLKLCKLGVAAKGAHLLEALRLTLRQK